MGEGSPDQPLLSPHRDGDNKFPSASKFIISNEICERFSYYGLTAILPLYLTNVLLFSEDNATVTMNLFSGCAYATALLGGYLSDAVLGKYKTILYVSIIYCIGSMTIAITAIPGLLGTPPHPWGLVLGLVLLALGTGGIKPVVSAFLGDQFTEGQSHLLEQMFRMFYFSINFGSTFSTVLTPLIRTEVNYAAAFALPAALLMIATTIFFVGRKRYVYFPPKGSVLSDAIKVVYHAIKLRLKNGRGKLAQNQSILYLAEGRFEKGFIDDVLVAMRVLVVFAATPIFWAVYFQTNVRWIFQAKEMDLTIGKLTVTADQVPLLSPALILILIPLFDKIIYPGITRFFSFGPLVRMACGMTLACGSVVLAGFLQIAIENSDEKLPVYYQLPQYFVLACGETLTSITGLEFSYTQAPKSMKSMLMAGWIVAISLGSYISAGISSLKINDVHNYFVFAILQAAGLVAFIFTAVYYKRKKETKEVKEVLIKQDSQTTDEGRGFDYELEQSSKKSNNNSAIVV